ncbi:MAG: hypothetical protein H5T33_04910 [Candidatus Methanosuratus sp.]|nr:hypothetical protein [Candidatus Methanosuratincola sp.]
MNKKGGKHRGLSDSLINVIFNSVAVNHRFFRGYESVVNILGSLSVVFTLSFLTFFFASGYIPPTLAPNISSPFEFALLIVGACVSLILHEVSHVIILANHGIRAKSMGISVTGIFGAYVQADMDLETYRKVKLPFYSCGVGSNLLIFLILFVLSDTIMPAITPAAAVSCWFLILNSIPAPLMDGGKIFESQLESMRIERYTTLISVSILMVWLLAVVYRFAIL